MSMYFRLNQMDVEFLARPTRKDDVWEPYVRDDELGEFYLTEKDEIEVREGNGDWCPVPLAYLYA